MLLLNAVPKDVLIPEAFAQLNSNPTITLKLEETRNASNSLQNVDLDD